MITIYTDGSSKGNPGPGGWGAVVFYDSNNQGTRDKKQWVQELGGREEHTTNNRMELRAAIESLNFVSKLTSQEANKLTTTVYTDSKYVMMGITEWVHNWVKKGWRTAGKKPVLNQDLWEELLSTTEGKQIEWKYVEGHAGHDHNERADVIATSFADLPRGTRGTGSINLYDGPKSEYK